MKRLWVLFALLVIASAAFAQTHDNVALGFNPNRMYQFGELDHVNLFNGDLLITIPVGLNYPVDEALSFQLSLTYNNKVWVHQWDVDPNDGTGYNRAYPNEGTNAGMGWRLSLGKLLPQVPNPSAPPPGREEELSDWVYEGPAGDRHPFVATTVGSVPAFPNVRYTKDSTYMRLRLDGDAYVDFPNGSTRKFTYLNGQWRLAEIQSSLGAKVYVNYAFDPNDNRKVIRWTITDSVSGRTHHVYFGPFAGSQLISTDDYGQIVQSITMQSVGGAYATYSFAYDLMTVPKGEQTHFPLIGANPPVFESSTLDVPVLRSVTYQTDNTSFAFTYGATNGLVTQMTVPTLGTYQYTYDQWVFPSPIKCDDGSDSPVKNTAAVSTRTVNGSVWKYYHDVAFPTYEPPAWEPLCPMCPEGPNGVDPNSCPHIGPVNALSRWIRTSVLNPRGDRTDYFFGGWSRPIADPGNFGSSQDDYGLPFTRAMYDSNNTTESWTKDAAGRFLSTRTYANCGNVDANLHCTSPATLLRTTYVTYDRDTYSGVNPRVQSESTEYDDDAVGSGYRHADVDRSDWDGFGHYRTETTGGNFDGTNVQTTYTNFNPNNLLPFSTWNLGTFTEQRATLGASMARSLSCFDSTGLLTRKRVLANNDPSNMATSGKDLISRFSRSVNGSLATVTEESFGGDTQDVGTAPDTSFCSTGFQFPTSPRYQTVHTYQSGVLTKSTPYSGGVPMPFNVVDRDMDPWSGLVTGSRDTGGVRTQYDYDVLGRLTAIRPPSGVAATLYTYHAATPNVPPSIDETSQSAGGTKKKYDFDGIGRIRHESVQLSNGFWSTRETIYNSMGQKERVSEFEVVPSHYTLFEYDSFGRPTKVTPPDSTTSNPTFTTNSYTGVRSSSRTSYVATAPLATSPLTTTETYDRFGRLIDVYEPNQVHTAYGYDIGGKLTKVCLYTSLGVLSPCGQSRTFNYDGRGFLTSETHPENGTFNYKYDARGHLVNKYRDDVSTFDLQFAFDDAERVTSVAAGSPSTTGAPLIKEFTYGTNAAGSPDNNLGKIVAAARHNRVHDPDRDAPGATRDYVVTETYHYDSLARVSEKLTSIANPLLGTTKTVTQSQEYNDLSLPRYVHYPVCIGTPGCGSQWTITNLYSAGLLASVNDFFTPIASMDYSESNTLTAITHGNGVRDTYTLDVMSRPAAIQFGQFSCPLPAITSHPQSQSVPSGGSAPLNVSVNTTSTPSFQWSLSTNSGASWTNVGTNSASYTATNVTATTWVRVTVTDCGGPVTSNTAVISVIPSLSAPAWVDAHAVSTTSVSVSWAAVSGAASYRVYRMSGGGAFGQVLDTTGTSFTDGSLAPNTTYVYGVRAFNGGLSNQTNDLATTITFTTPSIVTRATVDQLLTAVNAVRAAHGDAALQWSNILQPAGTTAPAPSVNVLAEHVLALRRQMDAALANLSFSSGAYTNPTLTAVPVKAVHIVELQGRAQ